MRFPLHLRGEDPHALSAPIGELGAGNPGTHAGEDLILPVKRKTVVGVRDQDTREQALAGQGSRGMMSR